MLVFTAIAQIIFTLLAIHFASTGDVALTVLLAAMVICEEISAQHQQDRKAREEAPHD